MSNPLTIKEFSNLIKNFKFNTNRRIGIAVSGGVDSMALAYLLSKTINPDCLKAYVVNHNLRPESTEEAEITNNRLGQLGLNTEVLTINWDKPLYPGHIKNSEQENYLPVGAKMETAARSERYSILGKAMTKDKINTIVLGHHANDQQETTLFRFSRHSGVVGLSGIHSQATYPIILHKNWNDYSIIRPLLSVPKTRLIDTCKEFNIKWEEDPTNQLSTGLIQRNVIRSILEKVNQPDCPEELKPLQFENFQKFCNNMEEHQVNIMKQTNDAIKKYITFLPKYGVAIINHKEAAWKDNFYFAARVLSRLNQWVKCGNSSPRLNTIKNSLEFFMDPKKIKSNRSNQYLVQLAGTILVYTPKKERLILMREPLTQICRIKNTYTIPKPIEGESSIYETSWDDRYFITCKINKNYINDSKLFLWCKMVYPMLNNLEDIEHTFKLKPFDHDLHSDRLIKLFRIYKLKLTDPALSRAIKQFYRSNRESQELIPIKSARTTVPVIVLELKGNLDGEEFVKEVVISYPTLNINFIPNIFEIDCEGKYRDY